MPARRHPSHLRVGSAGSILATLQPAASVTSISSVLIVDDEPALRDLMSRWVTSLGLRAATASNAEEALATLRGGRYDLAVVEVLMPVHDGLWLATEMQRDGATSKPEPKSWGVRRRSRRSRRSSWRHTSGSVAAVIRESWRAWPFRWRAASSPSSTRTIR